MSNFLVIMSQLSVECTTCMSSELQREEATCKSQIILSYQMPKFVVSNAVLPGMFFEMLPKKKLLEKNGVVIIDTSL